MTAHLYGPDGPFWTACGVHFWDRCRVYYAKNVTCGRCRRTSLFRDAEADPEAYRGRFPNRKLYTKDGLIELDPKDDL